VRLSFRSLLTLFFVVIVLAPMLSLTLILFRLISDNESGKADARVAARQQTAINLYDEARDKAARTAVVVGGDARLAGALRGGDPMGSRARAQALLGRTGARRIVVLGAKGQVLVDVGNRAQAVFPATQQLVEPGSRPFGRLLVSTETASRYAKRAKRLADLEVVVRNGDSVWATTLRGVRKPGVLPRGQGEVEVGAEHYRVAAFRAAAFPRQRVRVSVLDAGSSTSSAVRRSRLLTGAILAGFFLIACFCAILASRTLQHQIERFLEAARRLGNGDFSAKVPIRGRDEFAALGQEFNKMSSQLEAQLGELREQRVHLERTMRRIGEASAANLDRDALLEIVARTAVEGIDADGGRATLRDDAAAGRNGHDDVLRTAARVGSVDGIEAAMRMAEAQVLREGIPGEAHVDGATALGHPLRDVDGHERVAGVLSVARAGRTFTRDERDLFGYLAGQASVSMENVGLHEAVERQAVTDELTGLANRRRFQDTLTSEVERSRRFGQGVGLIMLDIDNFKKVNDTYGHQQGDVVLREVAKVLRATAREIDEPARYGGEELAVVLPSTDLEGAFNFAERLRESIEDLRLELPGDGGDVMQVTASFGVAAVPGSAQDDRGLVAAADSALYAAKRGGKNRTERAEIQGAIG
jgi:diguanylate cyclase (GGDEF)-like protein